MSNTANVKLGVCNIRFGGVDLGLTKGGVDVEVSTDTHKVMVDQFGESEINELITKRGLKVTVPMAETTLENMVAIMPGAVLVDNGIKQVWTASITTAVSTEVYTVTVDGLTSSFVSDASATEAEVIDGLVAAINLSGAVNMVAANVAGDIVLTSRVSGVTSVVTETGGDLSGAESTPAVVGTKRVDVGNGIGADLLTLAQELIIHPKNKAIDDQSEDFIIPLAGTAGGLQFAYKLDDERIFNVEFSGYSDANGLLYRFGDPAA